MLVGTEVVLVPETERVLVFPRNVVWAVCPELGLVEMVLVSPIGVELLWVLWAVLPFPVLGELVWDVEVVLSVCKELVLVSLVEMVLEVGLGLGLDVGLALCPEVVLVSLVDTVLAVGPEAALVWVAEVVLGLELLWGLRVVLTLPLEGELV